MSSQQHQPKILKGILFTSLLALLASCGDTSAFESMVRADPNLIQESVNSSTTTRSPEVAESENEDL